MLSMGFMHCFKLFLTAAAANAAAAAAVFFKMFHVCWHFCGRRSIGLVEIAKVISLNEHSLDGLFVLPAVYTFFFI